MPLFKKSCRIPRAGQYGNFDKFEDREVFNFEDYGSRHGGVTVRASSTPTMKVAQEGPPSSFSNTSAAATSAPRCADLAQEPRGRRPPASDTRLPISPRDSATDVSTPRSSRRRLFDPTSLQSKATRPPASDTRLPISPRDSATDVSTPRRSRRRLSDPTSQQSKATVQNDARRGTRCEQRSESDPRCEHRGSRQLKQRLVDLEDQLSKLLDKGEQWAPAQAADHCPHDATLLHQGFELLRRRQEINKQDFLLELDKLQCDLGKAFQGSQRHSAPPSLFVAVPVAKKRQGRSPPYIATNSTGGGGLGMAVPDPVSPLAQALLNVPGFSLAAAAGCTEEGRFSARCTVQAPHSMGWGYSRSLDDGSQPQLLLTDRPCASLGTGFTGQHMHMPLEVPAGRPGDQFQRGW